MLLLPRKLSSGRALAMLALAAAWLLEGLKVTSAFVHRLDKCEPIAIPRCRAMPYNMTRMPNLLHHRCVQVTFAELLLCPTCCITGVYRSPLLSYKSYLLHHRCVQVTFAELYILPAASQVCTSDIC